MPAALAAAPPAGYVPMLLAKEMPPKVAEAAERAPAVDREPAVTAPVALMAPDDVMLVAVRAPVTMALPVASMTLPEVAVRRIEGSARGVSRTSSVALEVK